MKFLKKAFSALLAAVTAGTMLLSGGVTAGAEESILADSAYVDGFYNIQGLYCLRIRFYGLADLLWYHMLFNDAGGAITLDDGTVISADDLSLYLWVRTSEKDDPMLCVNVLSLETPEAYVYSRLVENGEETYRYDEKLLYGACTYDNSDENTMDYGIVIIFPKGSKHLDELASAKNITLSARISFDNGSKPLRFIDPITVTPAFKELEKKSSTEKSDSAQIALKKTTLTAKRLGEKIKFTWKKVDGAEKYQIYYREKGESKYKKLATVSGSKTSYITSKLDKSKTYQFKIRSYAESNGKKAYSKFSKIKTVTGK